jgi:branched-chain amino acid transport system substrate-binding protein
VIWGSVLVLLIVGSIVWWTTSQTHAPTAQTKLVPEVKVGALLSLTGNFAQYGEDIQNGLLLAQEDVEKQLGLRVRLVVEDNASDAKVAVPAAHKLVDVDKVAAVVSGPGSTANLAVAPIMEAGKTSFIAISSTPKLNTAGKYVFKLYPDVESEVRRMAPYLIQKDWKRVAMIYDQSSDGPTVGQAEFSKVFPELGGQVVLSEGFDGKTTTDFRSMLSKVAASNPDAIYIIAADKLSGLVLNQARSLGLTQPVVGWSPLESPVFLSAAGAGAEGVAITAQPFSRQGSVVSQEFCTRYQERFNGRVPTQYAAYAYDSLHMIAQVVAQQRLYLADADAAADNTKLAEGLAAFKEYRGISGLIQLDDEGNIRDQDFIFRKVENGKFVEVEN